MYNVLFSYNNFTEECLLGDLLTVIRQVSKIIGSVSGRQRPSVRSPSDSTDRALTQQTETLRRLIGVERSHQAIWHWIHRLADSVPDPLPAAPTRVAADGIAVRIDGELSWIEGAIDTGSKLLLGVDFFDRRSPTHQQSFLSNSPRKTRLLKY